MTGYAPAYERQHMAEIPLVERAHTGHSRHAALEDCQQAAGSENAGPLRTTDLRALNDPYPETNRHCVGNAVSDRKLQRIAAQEPDATLLTRMTDILQSEAEHRPRE